MFLLLESAELQAHFGFLHVSCPYFQCYSHLDTGHIFFKSRAIDVLFILLFSFLYVTHFQFYHLHTFSFVVVQEFRKVCHATHMKDIVPHFPLHFLYWYNLVLVFILASFLLLWQSTRSNLVKMRKGLFWSWFLLKIKQLLGNITFVYVALV